jgi:hypothetical protein
MDQGTGEFLLALRQALGCLLADARVSVALVAVERVLEHGENPVDVAGWLRTMTAQSSPAGSAASGGGPGQPPVDRQPDIGHLGGGQVAGGSST